MTAPVRRRQPRLLQPTARKGVVDINARLEWLYVDITDIVPYEFNARNNAKAIPQVAASIKAFGFLIPCVIDENNVLVAGHTRVEAAKSLGLLSVPCVKASYLTEDQIKAFRLVDNKVSETATWNNDLLAPEMATLIDSGLSIDFTEFGWTQEAIDCMTDTVTADCLSAQDVANQTAAESNVSARRAPGQARMVLGEFVFFIQADAYRSWAEGIRQRHDFNEAAIVADLKSRLGILE